MVLPEPSRTVIYTTRNTVNRLARLELNSNPVILELSKEKEPCAPSSRNLARSDSCKKHKNFSEETRRKANMIPVKKSAVLANSSNHSRARRHNI